MNQKTFLAVSILASLALTSCATTTPKQAYDSGVSAGKKQVEHKLTSMDIHKVYIKAEVVGGVYIPAHYTYKYQKTVVGVNGTGGLQPQQAQKAAQNSVNGTVQTTTQAQNATAIAQNSVNGTPAVMAQNNGTMTSAPNEKLVSVVNQPIPPAPLPNLDNMVTSLNMMIENGNLSGTQPLYDTLKKAHINSQITDRGKYYLAMGRYKAIVEHNYKDAYNDFAQSYIDSKNANVDEKNKILALMAMCATQVGNIKDAVNAYKYIGDNYELSGDKLQALKYYYRANLLEPDNQSVNIRIANILSSMGKADLSKAFMIKAYLKSNGGQ